jgi:LmbE family N-acetylglucosaminyl deacetylase
MPRSLLLCFAHPDDESFFAAGTAHKYAAAGVNVVLCCGTRGERGSVGDPPLATIETLPKCASASCARPRRSSAWQSS